MNPQIIIFTLLAIGLLIFYMKNKSKQSSEKQSNLKWVSITRNMMIGRNDKERLKNVKWLDGLVKYGYNYKDNVYGRTVCRSKIDKDTTHIGIPGRLIKEADGYRCAIVDSNKPIYKQDFDILLDLPENTEITMSPTAT